MTEHRDDHLEATGGVRLYRQAWLPGAPPRGVVVISHGGAEHGGRYGHVVDRIVPEGFAVHAIDHRGHGRSEGQRTYIARLDDVLADLDAFVDRVKGEHPGTPLFLLGHSMGGLIALAYALRHQDRLDGLALSAPIALLEKVPVPLRLIARTLSRLAPRAGVYQVEGGAISRDPAVVQAYESDPLVYRGKLPARTVTEIADAVESFPEALPRLTLPLLVMHGTADRIVAVGGARLVHERAGSADKTLHIYDGYYHELFNEPAGERDRPLDDLAAWLAAHV